ETLGCDHPHAVVRHRCGHTASRSQRSFSGERVTEPLILVERTEPIAVVLLNRPKQLNALSDELMGELVGALRELDADAAVRRIVLGGSERVFAAGADIEQLARMTAVDSYYQRRIERWDAIRELWTPLVAAVSGYCL